MSMEINNISFRSNHHLFCIQMRWKFDGKVFKKQEMLAAWLHLIIVKVWLHGKHNHLFCQFLLLDDNSSWEMESSIMSMKRKLDFLLIERWDLVSSQHCRWRSLHWKCWNEEWWRVSNYGGNWKCKTVKYFCISSIPYFFRQIMTRSAISYESITCNGWVL